jgi:hypothetical protein
MCNCVCPHLCKLLKSAGKFIRRSRHCGNFHRIFIGDYFSSRLDWRRSTIKGCGQSVHKILTKCTLSHVALTLSYDTHRFQAGRNSLRIFFSKTGKTRSQWRRDAARDEGRRVVSS